MASTSPARIDDDLYASAKLAGAVQSRSASQQVAHWARIGREIEASQSISSKEIGAVLAGARSYDSLGPKEQAIVRAEWAARMDELRADVDLAASFRAAGQTWVELDDDGKVVERGGAKRGPAKVAAAKTHATKKAASKSARRKATSTKATSTKATSTKATSTKATSTKATPTKATPTKATPTKATSTKATSTKAGAARVRAKRVRAAG